MMSPKKSENPWKRFERALDIVAKSPPKHKVAKKSQKKPKKGKKIVAIILPLIFVGSPVFASFDHDMFCEKLTPLVENLNKDAGTMVDANTRNDGAALLCASKIIDFKKFLKASSTDMREGWQERKKRQWNEIYCKGDFLEAINNGWIVATTLTTVDGERTWIKAECP